METALLLPLVLFLQVFLLISSFTSTDGATLRTEEEHSPEGVERGNIGNQGVFGNRRGFWRNCRKDGLGCVTSGRDIDVHPPPPPPSPPGPDSTKRMNRMVRSVVVRPRRIYKPRFTSNCSGRPGGCAPIIDFRFFTPAPTRGPPGPIGYPSDCSWGTGGCGYPSPSEPMW